MSASQGRSRITTWSWIKSKVPLVQAHPTGENDGQVMLVLDNRLAETFTVEEAERFVPFLADAVAIALGYTSHPNEDTEQPLVKQPQPRPVRMHGVAIEPA